MRLLLTHLLPFSMASGAFAQMQTALKKQLDAVCSIGKTGFHAGLTEPDRLFLVFSLTVFNLYVKSANGNHGLR